MFWLVVPGCLIWLGILVAPWRPWSTRERQEADASADDTLDDITVLIPARDESDVIAKSVAGAMLQGRGIRVIVIDDDSDDDTAQRAQAAGAEVVAGRPLEDGWAGKLWALEQGLQQVQTPLVLLLDADIELRPALLPALRQRLLRGRLDLASLMAELRMASVWERLLIPAFVYFFKLLYPFRIANGPARWMAAAAGGCVLLRTKSLRDIGGFAALRGALIDDCTLAACIKRAGGRTWIGLSRDVKSLRPYDTLGSIWDMVARSAFTQLRYSVTLLLACTVLMGLAFWLPVAALAGSPAAVAAGAVAWAAMAVSYWPTLHYYGRSPLWGLALPVVGTLYLAMTWTSALRYWRGERSRWKGRIYSQA